jgi:hypothetical protein
VRTEAKGLFDRAAGERPPSSRSMVFAALGAAEVLATDPTDGPARALLAAVVPAIGPIPVDGAWPWPEPRLRYANAAVAEALIAAGSLLSEKDVLADGLRVLDWLLNLQTHRGRLSVVPSSGWTPGQGPPAFDQQPIEVAALASACARAHAVTGATRWATGVLLAHNWFFGGNDAGVPLADPDTGGCGDGLGAHGVSLNQGAESTLALLATCQQASYRMDAVGAA